MASRDWVDMVTEAAPMVTHSAAALLYFRAAAAWGSGMTLTIPDGIGGTVDLTKLYEQCRLIDILKGKHQL